jgi:homoserine kinase
VRAWSRRWPDAAHLIVATPSCETETLAARRVLPASFSREDAVFNLQRAAWLVRALCDGELDGIGEALRDKWHQPYRAPLVPGWDRLSTLGHDNLLGTFISGSGPSVVAVATGAIEEIEQLLRSVYDDLGVPADVRHVGVHQKEGRL